MSEALPVKVQDWVAADLDGTLFSRQWKSEHAVPGTWREMMGSDGSQQREASSWVRPGVHRPEAHEVAEARHILDPQSPAVMKMNGSMLERSCHGAWAQRLLDRESLHRHSDVMHAGRTKAVKMTV